MKKNIDVILYKNIVKGMFALSMPSSSLCESPDNNLAHFLSVFLLALPFLHSGLKNKIEFLHFCHFLRFAILGPATIRVLRIAEAATSRQVIEGYVKYQRHFYIIPEAVRGARSVGAV